MRVAISITEPALAQAKAVADPAIRDVLDLDSGEVIDAIEFITNYRYQALILERGKIAARINAGRPRFACPLCHVPVSLVSRPEEHIFFFRHRHEDGSCPAQTRSLLSYEEICARKYHGLRESAPHKAIKALIARSLDADPSFIDVRVERNFRSTRTPGIFRRPDVQATHESGSVAVEVQLSTTFLDVVVGRREFYRSEGALLLWVFGSFDPAYRRLTTDDLLFSNNSNVFVVDAETADLSERTGRFHLRCHYRQPIRLGDDLSDRWDHAIVSFADLQQDRAGQRVFLIDYSAEEAAIRAAIASEGVERTAAAERADRQDLFEFWLEYGHSFHHTSQNRTTWTKLRDRYALRGITLPLYPDTDREFSALLNAVYGAQEGRPVGWRYNKLVQVAHLLAESHPRLLMAFGHALSLFDRRKQITAEDGSGRWKARSATIADRLRRRDPELVPDTALQPLLGFIVPAIAERIAKYLSEGGATKHG